MMDNRDAAILLQRKRLKTASDSYSKDRLACPFYRNSSGNHHKHRSCAGPGWSTVHRVKEHILRQHARPVYCMRCSTFFITETELNKHLTLPIPCPLKISTSPPVGYNKEQERALRKRGRGPAEKQWKEIYKILFPLVSEELIPSPYYENNIEEWEKRRRRDLDQMQTYLGLELPRKVWRRLEQTSFQLPQPLQRQIFRQVIQIVEIAHADTFQSYRQQDINLPMRTDDPDITSYKPSNPDSAPQSQTTDGCGPEATLEPPGLSAMTEGTTHGGLSTSATGDIFEPFVPSSGLQYDLDSSVGDPNGMGQHHEGADWTDSQLWRF
ncbi:hypothetical protein CGCF415_v011530 [Colletotrichum fructicola]|nr:hypothetical protein CGCF415_v011530 [Colletotrichum fructicola]KAF4927047.1 hypothetical protein CGCF245_v013342 [Colletotrichum fructicola]KAF5488523.1 hypothetical protein CGCF413_v012106 [Colletotrichum fructicola]